VKGAALSDTTGTVGFYPRLLIMRGGTPSGATAPDLYCEYGDGSGALSTVTTLTKQPKSSTPAYEPVTVNIGGSADCGIAGPSGAVDGIEVPEGFYNVHASFAFFSR
jgi:hypothetical protein